MFDSKIDPYDSNTQAVQSQYAALCWRESDKGVEILLITSRDTGRWVIPKGWPVSGLSPEQSAAREAWEEAGVCGRADPVCLGYYSYDKILNRSGNDESKVPCIVGVYPVHVDRLRRRYPEHKQRRRKWCSPQKAARKVNEPELQLILASLSEWKHSG